MVSTVFPSETTGTNPNRGLALVYTTRGRVGVAPTFGEAPR